jgi:hypothetical protein
VERERERPDDVTGVVGEGLSLTVVEGVGLHQLAVPHHRPDGDPGRHLELEARPHVEL